MEKRGKLYIGTSGWSYSHWQNIFYPQDLPPRKYLKYLSKYFKTTEVNYSFYHLPKPSTFENWYRETPDYFVFAVKVSRFITHIKRLKNINLPLELFLDNALSLRTKLGPLLFQFPANFSAKEENIKRLEETLDILKRIETKKRKNIKSAFEFRNKSWFQENVYALLKEYKTALVIANSPNFPEAKRITTNFVYLRMHGSKVLFGSEYTDRELKNLARKIENWLKRKLDVYVYFNNDFKGYAVMNAEKLINFCQF